MFFYQTNEERLM